LNELLGKQCFKTHPYPSKEGILVFSILFPIRTQFKNTASPTIGTCETRLNPKKQDLKPEGWTMKRTCPSVRLRFSLTTPDCGFISMNGSLRAIVLLVAHTPTYFRIIKIE